MLHEIVIIVKVYQFMETLREYFALKRISYSGTQSRRDALSIETILLKSFWVQIRVAFKKVEKSALALICFSMVYSIKKINTTCSPHFCETTDAFRPEAFFSINNLRD